MMLDNSVSSKKANFPYVMSADKPTQTYYKPALYYHETTTINDDSKMYCLLMK